LHVPLHVSSQANPEGTTQSVQPKLALPARRPDDAAVRILQFLIVILCLAITALAADEVLIVADEFPAMEHVAGTLKAVEAVDSRVVWQTNLPPDLSRFPAVMVYIHRDLKESAEKAFISYAQAGGKLIVLHHSISSGKRKNKEWFRFLGVTLPEGDVGKGGYKWTEGITQQIVNLNSSHYITAYGVQYPEQVAFKRAPDAKEEVLPGLTLTDSEVYVNHQLEGPRTTLLGFKYTDAKSGQTWMQPHAGWCKPSGKGWIIYLQPGHGVADLSNPPFERILLNAVVWKP